MTGNTSDKQTQNNTKKREFGEFPNKWSEQVNYTSYKPETQQAVTLVTHMQQHCLALFWSTWIWCWCCSWEAGKTPSAERAVTGVQSLLHYSWFGRKLCFANLKIPVRKQEFSLVDKLRRTQELLVARHVKGPNCKLLPWALLVCSSARFPIKTTADIHKVFWQEVGTKRQIQESSKSLEITVQSHIYR